MGAVLCWIVLGCGYPTYRYVDEDDVRDGAIEQPDAAPPRDGCIDNGCGGCNAPDGTSGVKGLRCEPCGQWTCSGTSVVCTPAMPAPNSACGMCRTQRRSCTSLGTTACPMDDDRLVYEDAAFKSKDERQWVVDRTNEAVIAFKSVRTLSYFDVAVHVRRVPYRCAPVTALPHPDPACTVCVPASGGYSCSVASPMTPGELELTLFSGSPKVGLTPLSRSSLPSTALPDGAGWVVFPFAAEVSPLAVGTPLSLGLTTASTAHAFEVFGGGSGSFPAAAPDTAFFHRSTRPSGAWIEEPSSDLAHVLRGKACAP